MAVFHQIYHFHAWAEGTMSDLVRITGIKHLRVRGNAADRAAAVTKATYSVCCGIQNSPKQGRKKEGGTPIKCSFWNVKDQILRLRKYRKMFFCGIQPHHQLYPPLRFSTGTNLYLRAHHFPIVTTQKIRVTIKYGPLCSSYRNEYAVSESDTIQVICRTC
jgi:hypothetical protein